MVRVTLDPFLMSTYEVTSAQWRRVHAWGGDALCPAVFDGLVAMNRVSWEHAKAFCRRLSLDLPTEAQWEVAARAGTVSPSWFGGSREAQTAFDGHLNRGLDDWLTPALWNVGRHGPSPFGLYDVHGNMWEWCRDAFDGRRSELRPGDGRALDASATYRSMRGGGRSSGLPQLRAAFRARSRPDFAGAAVGLRPVRRWLSASTELDAWTARDV